MPLPYRIHIARSGGWWDAWRRLCGVVYTYMHWQRSGCCFQVRLEQFTSRANQRIQVYLFCREAGSQRFASLPSASCATSKHCPLHAISPDRRCQRKRDALESLAVVRLGTVTIRRSEPAYGSMQGGLPAAGAAPGT